MGRGKFSMNLIANEKSRKTTFRKREKSLMRKAYELSTLCDVRTCVFICGPKLDDQSTEVRTWPANRDEVMNMIKAYKTKSSPKRARNVYNLCDFFCERKKKIEAEISKLRKDIAEIKYPKWDERLQYLSEDQLRLFVDELDSKAADAKRRIDYVNGSNDRGLLAMGGGFKTESSSQTFNNANFVQEFLYEDQRPIFYGNQAMEIQPAFQQQIQEEALRLLAMSQNFHTTAISIPSMPVPIEQDMYFPGFIAGQNCNQNQFNYGMMEPVHPLSYQPFANQTACNPNSQMMMNSGFNEVKGEIDYMNYEFMMNSNNNYI